VKRGAGGGTSANPEHTPWLCLSGKLTQGQVAAVTLGPSTTWLAPPVSFDHIVAQQFLTEQCQPLVVQSKATLNAQPTCTAEPVNYFGKGGPLAKIPIESLTWRYGSKAETWAI
jgi:hypothetical protein